MGTSIGERFGKPIHRIPTACDDLVLPFAKVGVEIECENVTKLPTAKLISLWDHHQDNSLRNNGMEFTTKGGLVGRELIDAIGNACIGFKEAKFSEGYPRAGIHLHVDVTDMNENSDTQLLNMVLSYMMFEKAVFGWAGEWRAACGFCDPLYMSQKDFGHLSELLYMWPESAGNLIERRFSKYQAVNFLPMARFGTVEFRHLPTTFDSQRIIDWVNLCLCFKRYGMAVDLDPVEYMDKHGSTALIDKVFGKQIGLIAPYINVKELPAIALEVRALRVGRKNKPVLDSWDTPNNPLLLEKMKAVEAKANKKPPTADTPAGVAAAAVARPPRARVRRPAQIGEATARQTELIRMAERTRTAQPRTLGEVIRQQEEMTRRNALLQAQLNNIPNLPTDTPQPDPWRVWGGIRADATDDWMVLPDNELPRG